MMARETRGLSKAPVEVTPPSSIKRKRRGTPTPPPLPTPSIVPPTPETLSQPAPHDGTANGLHNGADEPEGKRAKITLKLKAPSGDTATVTTQSQPAEPREIEAEPTNGRGLSRAVRQALSLVIKEMATDLPPPINKILTLWLPPDFAQKPENTLGYVLQQDDLTWETLVDTLHVFCKNLLVPCNYPNPLPPTSQFHLPVPTLPSHYPYHPIYSFCAGLYTLMGQIAPSDAVAGTDTERWGLVQKVPNQSSKTLENGDWFTAGVDPREVGTLLAKMRKATQAADVKPDDSLLAKLASTGDRLGYANPVTLLSASAGAPTAVRTLNDSVLRKASLKAQRWKEIRAQRTGGFGNSERSVRVPPMSSVSFTPSFGATYDSNHYFAGYYDTMSAMHERARLRAWEEAGRRPLETKPGYRGLLSDDSKKDKGKAKETVEDILAENNQLIEELQGWQDLRVQKGDVDWLPEREQAVAQELLSSLTRLAAMTGPAELLGAKESTSGLAHKLAQRLLQTNAPSIRGVLDPRRPQAVHDNLTVRPKSASAQPLGGAPTVPTTPSPTTYPPRQSTMYQPHRQQPSYPTPSTPYRPPTPNYTYTSPFNQINYGGSPGVGGGPSPVPPSHNTRPPLAGPSGLRQSFGPGPQPQALQYAVPR